MWYPPPPNFYWICSWHIWHLLVYILIKTTTSIQSNNSLFYNNCLWLEHVCYVGIMWSFVACVVSETISMASATDSNNTDFHSLPDEIAQGFTDMQSYMPVGNYSFVLFFFCSIFIINHLLLSMMLYLSSINEIFAFA